MTGAAVPYLRYPPEGQLRHPHTLVADVQEETQKMPGGSPGTPSLLAFSIAKASHMDKARVRVEEHCEVTGKGMPAQRNEDAAFFTVLPRCSAKLKQRQCWCVSF